MSFDKPRQRTLDAAREQLEAANASGEEELAGEPVWNRKLTLQKLRKEAEALIDSG